MIQFKLNSGRTLQVLCLGAHSDDIEIGCGGTILRLAQEYPCSTFHWVVFSAIAERETEAQRAAALFVGPTRLSGVLLHEFPDGFLPFVGREIKEAFEMLKGTVSPDLIFCPSRRDAHQDHRLIGELTWNTFRDHLIWEYEIPKYDGDLGQPSVFVSLEPQQYQRKVDCLMGAFPSQHTKRWFEPQTFLSLMRLRGMECNSTSGYAEAFYCRKLVL